MLWFFNERTIECSLHQPLSDEACTHCSKTKVMKWVHSVVLSKINACVSERKVVCSVKRKVETFMQWHREKFCFHLSAGLGVVQVNTDKTFYATHHSHSLPRQIKPRALGMTVALSTSKLRRGSSSNMHQWRRPGSRDDNHSVHQLMFVFPRPLDHLSRFHRWVDLALLFKKGVTMPFPTSSVPAILFLNFADDALQVTWSPKAQSASRTFSWRAAPPLPPGSERYTATTLWFSMAVVSSEVSPRLARQCGSQEKRVQASGLNLQVLLNKVRTLGSKSSLKRHAQRWLEGHR